MSSISSELKSILYTAGAGAGKTTRLTEQFIQFANNYKNTHGYFPNIVVTTFTKKATQELRERLVLLAQKQNDKDLLSYLQIKSMVHISTIHGVLSLLLKKYGQEIGLASDFTFISDLQEKKQIKNLIKNAFIESDKYSTLLDEFTFRDLVKSIQKYSRFKMTEAKFERISVNDFKKMNSQYLSRFKIELDEIALQILESSSNEKWRAFAESGLQFQWISESEAFSDFVFRLEQFKEQFKGLRSPEKNPAVTDEIKKARSDWNNATKNLLQDAWYLTDEFLIQHDLICELFYELAEQVNEKLISIKINQAELTMSDLETMSVLLLERAPGAFESFSREWNYWMIDEYQDTSPLQVRLLNALVGQSPQFVVGDPQQSIYLFRGARSEVFQHKKLEFIENKIPVAELMTNYRSEPPVLNFINYYFQQLSNQFSQMEIGRQEVSASELPAIEIIKIKMDTTNNLESDSQNVEDSSNAESADELDDEQHSLLNPEIKSHMLAVISEIQKMINNGVNPQSICVLSKDNKTLDQLAFFANQFRLPIQQHSGGSFFDRPEVKDTIAVMQFLLNPHDNLNLMTLVRSPWFRIDDVVLHENLSKHSSSFWLELKKQIPQHDVISYLSQQVSFLNTQGIVESMTSILFERGLFHYAHRMDPSGRREANLWKLISLISEIEKTTGDFSELQQAIEQSIDPESQSQDSDATPVIEPQKISLMTIHASKGLQFDYVLLPMMHKSSRSVRLEGLIFHEENGTWSMPVKHPDNSKTTFSIDAILHREKLKKRESEESERLLYVALTRAKKGIRLFWNEQYKGTNHWAASCPLPTSVGDFVIENVKYRVRYQDSEPVIWADDLIEEKIIRNFWQEPAKIQSTLNISEILNKKDLDSVPLEQKLTSIQKARFGVEAHRIFEALKYHDVHELKNKITDLSIQQGLDYIAKIDEVPIFEIIRDGHVEWGFVIQKANSKIQGQIDLWCSTNDVDYIVDYKTGRKEYTDRALKQLEFYACCLNEMKKLKNRQLKLIVIYPMIEEIIIKEVENDYLQLSLDQFFKSGLEDLAGSKLLV